MSLKSTYPPGLIYSYTILPTRAHLRMFPTAVNKTALNVVSQPRNFRVTHFFLHIHPKHWVSSVQFSSVAQSCPTLCDPMDCNTPGLLVHHQLLEFTQTHVHRVSDAIQPSHPLLSPSPPAFNLSQHQGLFQ